jgi:XTP/dITP diphosphohydrolase
MVYFITSNMHKYLETREIFRSHGLELGRISKNYTEIQADTLEEVVKEALKRINRKKVFIEDAGIFIKALKGFPGVYSRYIEDTIGNQGILRLMRDVKKRSAIFKSVVGYRDAEIKLFKGEVFGSIAFEERGSRGFGYDPIFIPKGYNKTFAEDYELKQRISHRKKAVEKLAKFLSTSAGSDL